MVYIAENLLFEAELKARERAREEEERKAAERANQIYAETYTPTVTNPQPFTAPAPSFPVTTEMPPDVYDQPNAFSAPVQNTVSADLRRLLDQGSGAAIQARQPTPTWQESAQQLQRGSNAFGTLMDTFDAASETTFDIANSAPAAFIPGPTQIVPFGTTAFDALDEVRKGTPGDIVSDFRARLAGGGLPENIAESGGNPVNAFKQQGEDFESRPLYEQLGVGAVADPLNAVPGIGFADDIADVTRFGSRVLKRGTEVAQQSPVEQFRRTLGLSDEAPLVKPPVRQTPIDESGRLTDEAVLSIKGVGPAPNEPGNWRGIRVRAGDRGNIGTVVNDPGGSTVSVRFRSPEGATATKNMPRNQLTPLDQPKLQNPAGRQLTEKGGRIRAAEPVEIQSPAAQELLDIMRQSVKGGELDTQIQQGIRQSRASKFARLEEMGPIEPEQLDEAFGLLSGADRPDITLPVREDLWPDLFRDIEQTTALTTIEKRSIQKALRDTLFTGKVPTQGEINQYRKVFGDEFASLLNDQRSGGRRAWETFLDAAGVPRAMLSSFDLSAPGRQGALLIGRKEWWKNWGPMVQAWLRNPEYAQRIDDAIRATGDFAGDAQARGRNIRREQAGLSLARMDNLSNTEEAFQSTMANRIPVVGGIIGRSERAYTTYLNKLRADVFDNFSSHLDNLIRSGKITDAERLEAEQQMASWINIATGRGNLSPRARNSDFLTAANQAFFSPRLAISRVQALASPATLANPRGVQNRVKAQMIRDLSAFIGTGMSALWLAQATGAASVDLRPGSSDFMKIKVGKTRVDPWAGFQQYVVAASRLANSRNKGDVQRTTGRFLRGKLNPGAPALVVDVYTGETFLGDDVDLTDWKQQSERFLPISIQELADGIRGGGTKGGLLSGLSFVGVGTGTYETNEDKINNVVADLGLPENWADDPALVEQVKNHPDYPYGKEPPEEGSKFERVEEVTEGAKSDLATLAERVQAGSMPPEDYSDARGGILDNQRARLDELFRDVDDPKLKDVGNVYGEIIQKHTSKTYSESGLTESVDWEAVEADVQKLPKEQRDIIDETRGTGSNPLDTRYKNDISKIADTQIDVTLPSGKTVKASYFEIDDVLFEEWKEAVGANPSYTQDTYWDAVYEEYYNHAINGTLHTVTEGFQPGAKATPEQATNIARVLTRDFGQPFFSKVTDYRQTFRELQPEVSDTLRYWGIAGTGKEETGASLAR